MAEATLGMLHTGRLHVVCFEEAGDCTLERIAREATAGDTVLVLGPQAFAANLRAFGLHDQVRVLVCPRRAMFGFDSIQSVWTAERARAHGVHPRIAYGVRAMRVCEQLLDSVDAQSPIELAATPETLPPAREWPEGRRARIRRELGLSPHEIGVLVAGDPAEWIDLSFATRGIAMATVTGAPIRMIVSPRSARRETMGVFLEQAAHGKPIIVDERADRPWEILPAIEALVLDQDGVATNPLSCIGWRQPRFMRESDVAPQSMSPMPALWALACGKPALVHASVDLGAHASHALVTRFDSDVAQLARELYARASSASVASR